MDQGPAGFALRSVELFAGAGGLALGVGLAGFRSVGLAEWDRWACDTIRLNQRRAFPLVADWPAPFEGDVRDFDWAGVPEGIELLAGGPPCQPFSMGGKHAAFDDRRDMFPATVEIIRRLKPKAFIVENVKGLTRSAFANYYQYILLQLEFPEIPPRRHEDWTGHLSRLQQEKTAGRRTGALHYNVVSTLVNAADFGVPQKRERVFIVGFRADLEIEWSFPQATHSHDALLHAQWVSGEYWRKHGIEEKHRPPLPRGLEARVRRLSTCLLPLDTLPWKTVRDAFAGLPDVLSPAAERFPDHRFQDGARAYPGHTGSPLDLPAKTIKAGDHGVPGGENMLVRPDGSVRYFSIRETARLQTFPDGFVFHGSWTETMRQLGNAVPMVLARVVAATVAQRLIEAEMRKAARRPLYLRHAG